MTKLACKVLIPAAACTLLFAGTSQAEGFISFKPLLVNINSSAGIETIMPHFILKDSNSDGFSESMTYYYDVYKYASTTKLYSTTAKSAATPAVTCTNPYWKEAYHSEPVFVRSGKWVATGNNLVMECESQANGHVEAYNTFIYMADASLQGGVTRTLTVNNAELKSLELLAYDSDTQLDLVATVLTNSSNKTYARIIVKNITTWATIADKTYLVHQEP